jgi:hypothetical protein
MSMVACFMVAGTAVSPARAQQPAANDSPITAACGAASPRFSIQKEAADPVAAQPHPDQALVYLIEEMPGIPFVSSTVDSGLDGKWVGATKAETYMTLLLNPGVHHLCAEYQTHLPTGEQGKTTLLRLDLEAGKTYYILYRGLITKASSEVAFLEPVDEDEGRMLLQTFDHVDSHPKK